MPTSLLPRTNPRIHFIAGGFHLVVSNDQEIEKVVATLRDTFKVAFVAPGHCTGEPTFTALRRHLAIAIFMLG